MYYYHATFRTSDGTRVPIIKELPKSIIVLTCEELVEKHYHYHYLIISEIINLSRTIKRRVGFYIYLQIKTLSYNHFLNTYKYIKRKDDSNVLQSMPRGNLS